MTLSYIDLFPPRSLDEHALRQLSQQPFIDPTSVVHASYIGGWTEIGPNCLIVESTVDDYTYTAGDSQIIYTSIGKFCSIASHVRINPGNHPMQRVTQHHITYRRQQYGLGSDDATIFDWRRADACAIGHDVWIGHAAIIMPGVTVGTGAVVGAGAVVTKDVAPYTIVVGVPAWPLRLRFSEAEIEKLLAIAWWDWDRETLEARFDDLYDLPRFLEKYGG